LRPCSRRTWSPTPPRSLASGGAARPRYELIAARLDGHLDLFNKKLRALSAPELPDALAHGDLEQEWPALPFYARRRIIETLIARVTLLPTGRGCRQFDPSSVLIHWTF
jgi:hypothetical protein